MITMTPARTLTLAGALGLAAVLTFSAAAAADRNPAGASTPAPVVTTTRDVPARQLTAPALAERIVTARVRGDWLAYVRDAYGTTATGLQLPQLAADAQAAETDPPDPTAIARAVRVVDRGPTVVVLVRVDSEARPSHVWAVTLERLAAGGWHLTGEDRDPGGDPLPGG